jgi:monoterpene epsilon-lactone hydrolase
MASWQSRFVRMYLRYLKATTDWEAPVEKLRKDTDQGGRFGSLPKSIQTQRVSVEHMTAEWYIPPTANQTTAMLYLHGGGFATGSIKSHGATVGRIAEAGSIRTLLIEYRLAPDFSYPAALQDTVLAYRWLMQNGFQQILISADSAGCALALAAVMALREEKLPLPAQLVLLSPLIDLAATGESVKTNAKRDPWLKEDSKAIFKHYLAGNDPRNPLISPLYGDFSGFPEMEIHAGSDEILLSDATRLAEKAEGAGVQVHIKIWANMWHVFPFFAPFVPESQQAITEIGAAIRKKVGG